ncbi:hypothetical protein [Novosphingobium sp. FSW06-99]|uniref:hypothetical protein n=1 Tax=Novosphingobium sp. FSW06-99 TaxID=1739113 RepID=UPI00076BED16|nr:hypothetical protein [Novosphingobium sp. FSW06-99]KUR80658.1 hypothetical protein AQZ49_01045 [Novosphingobium sp. FSW06-99]
MIKFALLAATLLTAAAPTLALAAGNDSGQFTVKGVDYKYTTEEKSGDQIVRGTAYAGKVPFELHIHKKTVTGTFNDKPVEFQLSDVKKMGIDVGN